MPPTPVVMGAVIVLVAISMASASGLGVIAPVKSLLTVVLVAAVVVPVGFLSTLVAPAEEHYVAGGSPERGQGVFQQAGCIGCHTITGISSGTIGPNLNQIGSTAATRKAGMSAEAYIRESIQNPSAFVVPGFANQMPPGLASGENLDHLVAFLLTRN